MSDTIVSFENVSKKFKIQQGKYKSLRDEIMSLPGKLFAGKKSEEDIFWAIKNVNFSIKKGEVVGLVGPNGAGKSTILKLLSKIYTPTSGNLNVKGRFVSLIELGAGFHPELTGRENVYLNGIILGMTSKEIDLKLDEIVAFSELEGFIDTPMKKYSSGMFVRLAFSVAIHVDPEILFIDEVLAVGDFMFRDKCLKKMQGFRDQKKTMIIVSHERRMIENLCEKAIFLHKGEIIEFGETKQVMDAYSKHSHKLKKEWTEKRDETGELTQKDLEITKVQLFDKDGNEKGLFETEEKVIVKIAFKTNKPVDKPVFCIYIYSNIGVIHGVHSALFDYHPVFSGGHTGTVEVVYENLNLVNGQYYFEIFALRDVFSDYDTAYDIVEKKFFNVISATKMGGGIVFMKTQLSFKTGS